MLDATFRALEAQAREAKMRPAPGYPAAKEGHAPLVQEALMAGTAIGEREAEVRRIEGIKKMTAVEEENRWVPPVRR